MLLTCTAFDRFVFDFFRNAHARLYSSTGTRRRTSEGVIGAFISSRPANKTPESLSSEDRGSSREVPLKTQDPSSGPASLLDAQIRFSIRIALSTED
jgi:hypothetical protein